MNERTQLSTLLWRVPHIFGLIEEGLLALPDFQRRFEWSIADVRSYLSTVLAGLPAGNVLIADNFQIKVELRPLEGAPDLVSDPFDVSVLLDGQQRLTALWQATHDVGPDRYFVDFRALMEGSELLQDNVVVSTAAYQADRFVERAAREGAFLVPVSALLSPSHFFSWLSMSADAQSQADSAYPLGEIFANHIQPIFDYEIPVTRLSGDLTLSTAAQIFERLNKGGQRLDVFDLLVARLQGAGWSLRQAWDDALRRYPQVERVFGENGFTTISAISLLLQSDVRRSAVLSLPPHRVAGYWKEAVLATKEVADLLLQEGVRRSDLLPYDAVAITMIAGRMAEMPTQLLVKYFWLAAGSLRYEVASNTKVVADFRTLNTVGIGPLREEWTLKPEHVELNTRRSSKALWATLVSLILSNDPLDLATGTLLSSAKSDGRDEWELVSIVKGGGSAETERDTPARLRTAGQLISLPGKSSQLRRLGLVQVVQQGIAEPQLFGASMEERLRSQLMPDSRTILGGSSPRELIERRSLELYSQLKSRIF